MARKKRLAVPEVGSVTVWPSWTFVSDVLFQPGMLRLSRYCRVYFMNGSPKRSRLGVLVWLVNSSAGGGELVDDAVADRASGIIVAHNHPSGGLEPSPSDIAITGQLKAAGEIIGIELLDHIIFNRNGYFSFLEEGKL